MFARSATPYHRPVALSSLVLGAIIFASTATAFAAPAEAPHLRADRARIQQHLRQVEARLLAADARQLTPTQRAARARNIERLRAYRQRGIFPHNTHRPYLTPVFIDRDGRACAVGYLMQATAAGREAAAEVARHENLARVPDIRSKKALRWIAQSGLTAAECALIQPSYGPPPRDAGTPADKGLADQAASPDKGVIVAPGDDGGCAVGHVAGQAPLGGALGLLLLLGLLRRRSA